MKGLRNRRCKRRFLSSRDGGARCRYCGRRQKLRELTIDHVIPLSRGGTHAIENLVLSCAACNGAKADRPVEDFLAAGAQAQFGSQSAGPRLSPGGGRVP